MTAPVVNRAVLILERRGITFPLTAKASRVWKSICKLEGRPDGTPHHTHLLVMLKEWCDRQVEPVPELKIYRMGEYRPDRLMLEAIRRTNEGIVRGRSL